MQQFNNPGETNQLTLDQEPTAPPVVRSYRRIARMLAEREGMSLSAERVRQICLAAEKKFTRALLTEVEIDSGLRTARVQF